MKRKSLFFLIGSLLFSGIIPATTSCSRNVDYFSEVHFDTIRDLNNDLVYSKISILKSYIANKQNIDLYELPNCEMFRTIFRTI